MSQPPARARSAGPGVRPVVLWFRNDLRLHDNAALIAAAKIGPVLPVFVLDDAATNRPLGAAARWWLHHSLTALDASIAQHGGRLLLRRGPTADVLAEIAASCDAAGVYFSRSYEAAAVQTERLVIAATGVDCKRFPGGLLLEPEDMATRGGSPFRVFTPFWNALRDRIGDVRARDVPQTLEWFRCDEPSDALGEWQLLPQHPDWAKEFADAWQPGEQGAQRRLATFLERDVVDYQSLRDRPDHTGTSRLSPHLRFGEISPRSVWQAAAEAMTNNRVGAGDSLSFRRELAWREFSWHLLFHNPDFATRNFRPNFDRFPWRTDEPAFEAWCRGRTGYPLVDAGMRELWRIGWMHNRVRMVVASFLTKHLRIDWRAGEQWFWDTLVDADAANNPVSWQWVAGSGADAAPYFRIFNPVAQGVKFDPDGEYVRRWVPELAALPSEHLHAPWMAQAGALEQAEVELGRDYPRPIVDHAQARQAALDAYAQTRESE
jgi:deoxyribodipyrimidine photo-lyase